jgi:SAM-dependent methyltransferase
MSGSGDPRSEDSYNPSMTGRPNGTEGYGETADALVKPYESVSFADVHREILHLIPATPSRVLDVGAGTGRDAAALAALGHTVVAVEPTPELRMHGQRLHPGAAIIWIDDSLPDLDKLHARGEHFDLVMLTAVWMHLDPGQRERAMARIAGLLQPGGLATLLLRHGPVPTGRRMFDVSAAETRALADHHGLKTVHDSERPALLGGSAVWWSVLAVRAPA